MLPVQEWAPVGLGLVFGRWEKEKQAEELSGKDGLYKSHLGFPRGSVVKNPPASAGDGFDPWSGSIPRAPEHLGPCTAATAPAPWRPGTAPSEAWALEPLHRRESSRHSEKPCRRSSVYRTQRYSLTCKIFFKRIFKYKLDSLRANWKYVAIPLICRWCCKIKVSFIHCEL